MFEYNTDYKKRDQMVLGKIIDWKKEKNGGTEPFKDMSLELLNTLIEENFIDPKESQNYSPTTQEFLELMQKFPSLRAHGYVVSPERDDYRVAIEGVDGENFSLDDMQVLLEALLHADSLDFSIKDGSIRSWWD